jgi:hypothetical protein
MCIVLGKYSRNLIFGIALHGTKLADVPSRIMSVPCLHSTERIRKNRRISITYSADSEIFDIIYLDFIL